MISNPFSTAAATQAGHALAQIVMDGVPLSAQKSELKHAKKVSVSMTKMAQQIEWLKLQHSFNFFQKAKLGTTLQWQLKDAGYEANYIRELTEWVMMRLK
jgi:hypothetical protein